eukprot:g2458.t1
MRSATALSDELIAEIQQSDTLLLAVPIYNFSIPAALKAWIDQIMRIGHTFSMDENGFQGLVKARRAVIVCAYGSEGYLVKEPFAAANFLEPYLNFLFTFLGIETIEFVHVQGTATAVLKAAKGYYGRRKNTIRVAKQAVEKAGQYAYRDRKAKKRNFRSLWIQRINAATRQHGMTYGNFINGLNKAGVEVDRKVLSDLAINQPDAFKALVDKAQGALAA